MAKKEKVEKQNKEDSGVSSSDILGSMMEATPEAHLNYQPPVYYKVPFKCLDLDDLTNGGLEPGVHRFIGPSEGGKSSLCFDVIRNFLEEGKNNKINRKALVINAEGKQPKELEERTGLKIVRNVEDWDYGTVFVLESNIFEFIFTVIRRLINTNPKKDQYIFMIDSIDALVSSVDDAKRYTEGKKVAGGALLSKRFLSEMTIRITKLGHMLLITSQVSASIKSEFESNVQMNIDAVGGHGLIHFCTYIFQFIPTFNKKDYEYESGVHNYKLNHYENSIIGKDVAISIKKSASETSGEIAKYPIRRQVYGKSAIWMEKDIYPKLRAAGFISLTGSWIEFEPNLLKELSDSGLSVEPRHQGETKFVKYLESNPELTNVLYEKVLLYMKYKREGRKIRQSEIENVSKED